ncbi:MAG: hypothetical protein DRJ01_14575 [Bacteroidetes bacterium]|nr:MAG: hypothetical protein DRJ01_14575 [Bacteroidota bacterium]
MYICVNFRFACKRYNLRTCQCHKFSTYFILYTC